MKELSGVTITLKQARAIKGVSENIGKPLGQVMLEAGYSERTSKTPSLLRNSKAWLEWINGQLPDNRLFKAHREALTASKWNDFTGEREADHSIRLKAAVEGYKVKGYGQGNANISNTQINISFDGTGYIPPQNVLDIKPTKK